MITIRIVISKDKRYYRFKKVRGKYILISIIHENNFIDQMNNDEISELVKQCVLTGYKITFEPINEPATNYPD